jgi:hypothetical protein
MRILLTCCLIVISGITASAQLASDRPVRMVVEGKGTNIPEGSFATKPKTIYRLGTKFARIEEEANPSSGIKALMITKAPDTWMIDLNSNTGRHIVDPDPKGKVVFPIFPSDAFPKGFPREFDKLEFGDESRFFDGYNSPAEPFKTSKADLVKQYVGIGDWGVSLAKTAKDGVPVFIFLFFKSNIYAAYMFTEYEIITNPSPKLFEPPSNVKISD